MNARYYLPGVGRFVTADTIVPDPTSPQSFNRYSYVLNRPLVFADPSGHCLQYAGDNRNPDELAFCIYAWNELGRYYGAVTGYGDQYPQEHMRLLLEEATTSELRSMLESSGITYDENRNDYSWDGVDLNTDPMNNCIAFNGGGWNCPPDGGWPKYYPGTEEYAEKVIFNSTMILLLLPVGPLVGEVTALEGFSGWIINSIITNRIKWVIKEGIQNGIEELASPPLTTDIDPSKEPWITINDLNTSTQPLNILERNYFFRSNIELHIQGER